MATYESYKDSGVNWLGEIPSHWEVKKLRAFFSEVSEVNSATVIHNQLQFKYGTIVSKPDTGIDNDVLKTISKYTIVRPGDIVINGLNLNYDFLSFRVGKVNELGVITSAYISMRPNPDLSAKFYEYLLKAMDAKKVFHGFGTGIRATLSFKELKHKSIPLVPLAEQEAIVAYLDKVTAEFDRAIEAQQKMIDALNERKQIIITRAVTRGLNPDAPLRDSDIDWLGQIPAHWDTRKIKFFARLKSGKNLTSEQISPKQQDNFYPVYGGNGVRGYYSKFNTSGDFAIIGRQGALCGNVNYAHGQFWATDHAVVCYPIFNFILLWFGETLKVANLNQYATQSAQPGLSVERVKNVSLPCPPKDEMLKIADYIQKVISEFSPAIAHCERLISLLQERKQIIINEVVTGKKKVI